MLSCESSIVSLAGAPRDRAPAFWRHGLLLTVFAMLIALARLHTYNEPIDRDLGDYATAAHEMHAGKHLYSDLPDQKPPGVHVTYYLAESLFGYNRLALYAMTVAAGVMGLLAVYASGVCFFGPRAALWAAAFWTAISGHVCLEANRPNTEVFMNAFLLAGIAVFARNFRKEGAGWTSAVLAGLCFALATLFKQVVAVIPAILALAYWVAPPAGKSRNRAFAEALLIGGTIIAIWAAMLGWFAWNHRLDSFVKWVVTYNRGYAGKLDSNILDSLHFIFPDFMNAALPLAWLAGFGMLLAFVRRQWQPALLLLALAIGTQMAVALPGKYFPHYYQLWFPWLMLGAGAGIAAIEEHLPIRALGTYAGVTVLGLLLGAELPNYLLSADQWSDLKYGSIFIDSNAAARRAAAILKPDETLFQFGDETEIYPVAGRGCPWSLTAVNGLYEGVFTEECRVRLLKELNARLPDLMIVAEDAGWEFENDARITGLFREHYVAILKGQTPPYSFMARKGSDLERRMNAEPPLPVRLRSKPLDQP